MAMDLFKWQQPASSRVLDEEFIQNSRGYSDMKTVPLPHEEFDQYLSQYSEFDAILSQSLANVQDVQDLDISPSMGQERQDGGDYNSLEFDNNSNDLAMTVTSSMLSKYSRLMNLDKNASAPDGYEPHEYHQHQLPSSPIKEESRLYLQPPHTPISLSSPPSLASSSSAIFSSPQQPSTSPQQRYDNVYLSPNPRIPYDRMSMSDGLARGKIPQLAPYNEADSDPYFSSSEHSLSPNLDGLDTSPEVGNVPQFYSVVTPNLPAPERLGELPTHHDLSENYEGTSLVQAQSQYYLIPNSLEQNVVQLQHQNLQLQQQQKQLILQAQAHAQAQVEIKHENLQLPTGSLLFSCNEDLNSSIAWQPIVMAPKNSESQQIIRLQQTSIQGTHHSSNRRSGLPPGKVDSYMSGPDPSGLFLCLFPNCGKLFRRRYNIRSHIQTHLCDRPYSCDTCNACFVRPHDLRRHEKCHKEEKPFICPCGKAFSRHDALQRHRIRQICEGGIEIPGRPKKPPGKRGRPRKFPVVGDEHEEGYSAKVYSSGSTGSAESVTGSSDNDSESDQNQSPYSPMFVQEEIWDGNEDQQ